MSEQWRAIPGYEGSYEVSNLGRVRSLTREVVTRTGQRRVYLGKVIALHPDDEGRLMARLHADGQTARMRVHRLVLTAFIGPCPDGMEGCHNDGDKLNNRIENLRWDTRSENTQDQIRHGVHYQASKTHCPVGHPYAGDNLDSYVAGARKKQRRCRTCHRKGAREQMRRNYVPSPRPPKLTAADVAAIRGYVAQNGRGSGLVMSRRYGVSQATVSRAAKDARKKPAEETT